MHTPTYLTWDMLTFIGLEYKVWPEVNFSLIFYSQVIINVHTRFFAAN